MLNSSHIFSLFCCAIAFPLNTFAVEEQCLQPLNATVTNSCVVFDHVLWRGARPTAEAAASLVDMGVKTVVSLELLNNDLDAFKEAKPSKSGQSTIQYFQIRDWEPLVVIAPGKVDDHIAHFLAVARTQPAPLYVHCRSGQNRTGIMVAAYKIFNGADLEQTIAEMEKYKGIWAKSDAAYLRKLTPEKRKSIEIKAEQWIRKIKATAIISCRNSECTVSTTQ